MMRVFAFIFLVVAVRASELGQVGTCVEMCSSDSECPAGQACLSNGCGHTCQTAVTLPDKKCQPVLCLMYCEYGWVRDDDGCEICACNWDPILSTPAALLSDLGEAGACVELCSSDSQCPAGQACLSNGCGHTCQTAVTLPGDKKCEPVRCRMYCQNGWVKDDNGCEICECNWKPTATESPGAVDKRGACVDECTMTNSIFKSAMGWQQCPEGQSCVSNGCGHTCQPDTTSKKSNKKCQDVVCYMFCENGWAKDDDGCEICACA